MKPSSGIAVSRLARQLRMTPEKFNKKALAMAVRIIDNAIAHHLAPFEGCLVNDFDCSSTLNGLTEPQLARLADVHPIPQVALRLRSDRRRGIIT